MRTGNTGDYLPAFRDSHVYRRNVFTALIVEDNPHFAEALCAALQASFPFLTLLRADGVRKAVAHLDATAVDVVIVDLNLADGNGLELVQLVRARGSDAVLIVLTAHDLQEYRDAAFKGGANYFLAKGAMDLKEIYAVVELILTTRFRALVVADDARFRDQMSTFLTLVRDSAVVHATGVEKALAAAFSLKPDLVVLRSERGAEHERESCESMRTATMDGAPVLVSVRNAGGADTAPCPADYCVAMDGSLGKTIEEIVRATLTARTGMDPDTSDGIS